MMFIAVVIMINLLAATNVGWAIRVHQITANAPTKIEYKEIEVVKKAMCECDHVSSAHKAGTGPCQTLTFFTDGGKVKTNKAIECPCTKYTGPIPLTQYFDDQQRELESHRV